MALGAIAAHEQEHADLIREEAAILGLADAGTTPSQEQFDRLGAIQNRLPTVEANLASLKAARDRKREQDPVEAAISAVVGAKAQNQNEAPRPFATLGEQLQAVARAALNPHAPLSAGLAEINNWKIGAATGASELVGSDGGFLVQSDFQNDIRQDIFSTAVLAPLATTREIGAGFNGVKFNVIDETSRATGSRYGGVRVYAVAEGGTKTASRPKIRQEELTLQKAAGLYVATDELLQDTVALGSFVRPSFISEFAFWLDDMMIRGTGAGEPLGILNSAALISVAKESGQAADTVLYENLVAMISRLTPGSVRNARWFINSGVWATFPTMKFEIGTGGVPVFLPPGGASDAPFGTILGRPIEVIEQASAIGDKGDIILADWSEYLLIRKGGIAEDTSIHVYFDTDETAFRWVMRVNGRPLRQAAVTPYKGTVSTSPFVTLDAR